MKKSLLIITSFCIGIVSIRAQISINSSDMPVPSKIIYLANDTLPTISVGTAGTNKTWNMAALAQHTADTSTTMPYSSAPNAKFSTANLVVKQGGTGFYGYFINSASSMSLLGGSGVLKVQGTQTPPINQVCTPAEIAFKFPATYDSSFTNHYFIFAKFYYGHTVQGFMVDSVQQRSGVQKTFLIDAWGTLTTPLAGGPYTVLRIKETKISHDTTMAYANPFGWNVIPGGAGIVKDSITTYTWWAKGIGAALAMATMDSTGSVKKVQWLKSLPVNGISEYFLNNSISIYPNPATNKIMLQYDASTPFSMTSPKQELLIEIRNELGQCIKKIEQKQLVLQSNGKTNEMVIDVADLPSGAYFIQIQNQNNTINKKFIKQ